MEELEQVAREVMDLRNRLAAVNAEIKDAQEQFRADHARQFGSQAGLKAFLEIAENNLRELTVAAYRADPEHSKRVTPYLGIQEHVVLTYDQAAARQWCIDKDLFLDIKWSEFEKAVSSTPSLAPFVKVDKEPRGTIATDLGKALR